MKQNKVLEPKLASFVKNTFGVDVRSDAAVAAEAILSQLVPGAKSLVLAQCLMLIWLYTETHYRKFRISQVVML